MSHSKPRQENQKFLLSHAQKHLHYSRLKYEEYSFKNVRRNSSIATFSGKIFLNKTHKQTADRMSINFVTLQFDVTFHITWFKDSQIR